MPEPVRGFEWRVYYDTGGTGGLTSWTELTIARDVTPNFTAEDLDKSHRGDGAGWRISTPGRKTLEITMDVLYDPDATNWSALQAAAWAGTSWAWFIADGGATTIGTEGWQGDFKIHNWETPSPLDGAVIIPLTLRLSDADATYPKWHEVTA